MASQAQKPKKKPPRPGLEERIPNIAPRSFLTARNFGIALLFFVALYLISPGLSLQWVRFKEGDYPKESILAKIDFEVQNLEATRLAREQAANLTPPVYVLDLDLVRSYRGGRSPVR